MTDWLRRLRTNRVPKRGQSLDLSACSCFFSCLAALGSLRIRLTCWLIDAGWPIARPSAIHSFLTEVRRFTNAAHTTFLGSLFLSFIRAYWLSNSCTWISAATILQKCKFLAFIQDFRAGKTSRSSPLNWENALSVVIIWNPERMAKAAK